MSVQRTWEPFSEMLSLRDAMGQLLEGSFVRPGTGYAAAQAGYSFPLNVHGTANELQVEALLPGVSQEDVNSRAVQEARETGFVLRSTRAREKARMQLVHDDQRHQYPLGRPQPVHGVGFAPGEVHVPSGVDGDHHRQTDASTWSWARIASSNAGSSRQVPAKLSRSV